MAVSDLCRIFRKQRMVSFFLANLVVLSVIPTLVTKAQAEKLTFTLDREKASLL